MATGHSPVTYAVTVAGRPAGTLTCDLKRPRDHRWRWRSAGNQVEHFREPSAAKDQIAWLHRCHWREVRLVEAPPAAALEALSPRLVAEALAGWLGLGLVVAILAAVLS